ncbi:exodeoxyribonuclease VII large subunit [Collinsella sp. An307]|uniref:exodeoxyribonuclease VII large subunit n=1 Tax=Collinsella sp. An307 TaxID=1965630 RepID=UPI000B377F0A|nr:exodeoxyribonuclease VII large subunit [Collinsella sp. An307]OUO22445.1 exodeoxyribonuclease VII large subunit [Collinsella sp. An307]
MTGWNLTGKSTRPRAATEPLPWEQGATPGSIPAAAAATGADGGGAAEQAEQDPNILTVTQAVGLAGATLAELPPITVLGEVSGFRGPYGARGHCYFQIKDESSSLECIIWGGVYKASPYELRNGLKMRFTGKFEVYARTGKMSFQISRFEPVGEGLLRQQVAALAEKLRREGLMDESRKRPIPAFCTRVAVVTSLSGAVIDDVKRTLRRRNPLVELICVGSKVQGEGAEAELIEALARAAAIEPAPDCILLVRGGGSFEDLMTFNDEALARAVAASPVPVITGIGHEPDTSICDMVSDRRCSTPTAAAESVAPAATELAELLATRERRLAAALSAMVADGKAGLSRALERASRAMGERLSREELSLRALAARPCLTRPDETVLRRAAELEQSADRLEAAMARGMERQAASLDALAARLPAPGSLIAEPRHALELALARLAREGRELTAARGADLARQAASLDALSPLKVLGRGYAIAYREGTVATSATTFAAGDELTVRFADGEVAAAVERVDAK